MGRHRPTAGRQIGVVFAGSASANRQLAGKPAQRAAHGVRVRYTLRLLTRYVRVLPAMEINPILNTIKDLSERSETIRGYL